MNNKITKKIIHAWITVCSVITMVIGWAFIAKAENLNSLGTVLSTSSNNTVQLDEIADLESLTANSSNSSSTQTFTLSAASSSTAASAPQMRTGGS